MELTKTHKIIISVVVVIILLGIYIMYDRKSKQEPENEITDTTQTATTTDVDNGIKTTGSGSYTIEPVSFDSGSSIPKPIPDLDREPVLYGGAIISPEAKAVAVGMIKKLQTQLKTNPVDVSGWINLGIYQKQAGDYDGAILSWKYASRLSPTDYVSLANIGNLYAYFIKDNAQVEIYYKQAISKGPLQSYLYTQLVEIYRDVFGDLDKARAIINEGLSKIPNDPNLLQLQASLK